MLSTYTSASSLPLFTPQGTVGRNFIGGKLSSPSWSPFPFGCENDTAHVVSYGNITSLNGSTTNYSNVFPMDKTDADNIYTNMLITWSFSGRDAENIYTHTNATTIPMDQRDADKVYSNAASVSHGSSARGFWKGGTGSYIYKTRFTFLSFLFYYNVLQSSRWKKHCIVFSLLVLLLLLLNNMHACLEITNSFLMDIIRFGVCAREMAVDFLKGITSSSLWSSIGVENYTRAVNYTRLSHSLHKTRSRLVCFSMCIIFHIWLNCRSMFTKPKARLSHSLHKTCSRLVYFSKCIIFHICAHCRSMFTKQKGDEEVSRQIAAGGRRDVPPRRIHPVIARRNFIQNHLLRKKEKCECIERMSTSTIPEE
jgi:hypothetical protein